jgi:hypothetical protein
MKTIITLCSLPIFAALTTFAFAADIAPGQAAAPAANAPSAPACPCDFNIQFLNQKIAAMQKASKSCMVLNTTSIDRATTPNEYTTNSVTLNVVGQGKNNAAATQAPNSTMNNSTDFNMAMADNMVNWSIGYTNDPALNVNPAAMAMSAMMTGKYCTTNVMDPAKAKPLKNLDEYIYCMGAIIQAAKSIKVECIPVTNIPEITSTQPAQQLSNQPLNAATTQQPSQYVNHDIYQIRSYFKEIVDAASPYRVGVGECVQVLNSVQGCNAGTNKIPAAITAPTGAVQEISVINGVIKVVPVENAKLGIKTTDTYILYPTANPNSTVTWESAGGAITQGYAD